MKTPDIYTYPEGASPLELARYQVAVITAAEEGLPVEFSWNPKYRSVGRWSPIQFPSWDWRDNIYRIARPEAAKIAEGHNPDGLTEEQVGVSQGWRLLSTDERAAGASRCFTPAIEAWKEGAWDGTRWAGSKPSWTYRTKKPAGFFLPKPAAAEKPLVPWTLQTVPKNNLLLRRKNQFGSPAIILAVGWDETGVAYSQHGTDSYDTLYRLFEYSTDGGETFVPCGSTPPDKYSV